MAAMSANGNELGRPLRVAVIGSGPAAFYAAAHLLANEAEVDMVERLPTPWGLVRLGVAPDHPKLKAVSRAFEKIALRPGFRFFGNVEVGRDAAHDELARLYDAVVYAVGAQTDRRLGIPGEDLPGSWSATAFVAWYNGHPDFQDLEFDLSGERAVVVGNGNVAIDVARMLALTAEELATTDTTDPAIEAIVGSGIHEIVMLGRRGPAQASFTPPELQELGELAGADVVVDPADLELDPASRAALEHDRERARRNVDILQEFAARAPSGKPRTVRLRFLVSPVAILGNGRVEAVEVVRNELVADERGQIRAVPTQEREVIPCGVAFRSVGYRGVSLPGVPFDEQRGTMPNRDGRVLDAEGKPIAGLYCAGWIKRGPTGVIGTNKKDATETVELLLEDARAGALPPAAEPEPEALERLLLERGVPFVEYAGWESIDRSEREAGEPHGRPRIKLCSWDDLLAAAGIGQAQPR
jgi:ferredoxin--NADP+ reductase